MNSLEIRNFSLVFRMYDTGIRKTDLQVITDLNLSLRPGEIHAVVGSSGSGKSLLAHAILGILPRNASCGGEMLWFGQSLTPALQKKLRGNQLALVPQSVNYLDPLMRVGKQVSRNRKTAIETLRRYELDNRVAKMYPFERPAAWPDGLCWPQRLLPKRRSSLPMSRPRGCQPYSLKLQ